MVSEVLSKVTLVMSKVVAVTPSVGAVVESNLLVCPGNRVRPRARVGAVGDSKRSRRAGTIMRERETNGVNLERTRSRLSACGHLVLTVGAVVVRVSAVLDDCFGMSTTRCGVTGSGLSVSSSHSS